MNNLIKKSFNQETITFDLAEDVMINLTEMAKANDKEVKRWLDLDSTRSYISKLPQKDGKTDLIIKQGLNGGTWGSRRVAIRFAQWLSDDFAIWVDTQIEELLINRITRPSYLIDDSIERAKVWIIEEQERRSLLAINSALMHINKTYTTSEIAKELGYKSATALNQMLSNRKIQYKRNGTWIPYSKYSELGLVEIKQGIADNGHTYYNTRWTQQGRLFILELLSYKEVA